MRRTLTIILIIVALALGIGAIYIGYRLTREEPTDVSVAEGDVCGPGGDCRVCGDGSCNSCCQPSGPCGSDSEAWTAGYFACNEGGGTSGCTVTNISAQKDSVTISGDCSVEKREYTRSYSGTSHLFQPDCITNDSNGTGSGIVTVGAGTYAAYTPGQCVQIDLDGDGVNIGVCRCVPAAPTCGDGIINQDSEECESGVACSGENEGEVCDTSTCTCSPAATNACGDGVINQESEECEVGVACEDPSETCNESTCLCISEECGNGVVDPGEYCDPTADPTGCLAGETCNATCQCDISVTLPSTAIIDDKTDELLYAALAVASGLLLLKFNLKDFIVNIFKKSANFVQTGRFAYLTAPVSGKAKANLREKKKDKFEEKIRK